MAYSYPTWEFEAKSHLLKLQRLKDKFFLTIGNLPRRTLSRGVHGAFKSPYLHDFVTAGN
jgi:hypothetical protein